MIRRKRLQLYLRSNGAFSLKHANSRSLGEHLMGVHDILCDAGFNSEVCMAGGLHSIYGTSIYKTILNEPTEKKREEVRNKFGIRAEYLAFLFHVTNRPEGLAFGNLLNRFSRARIQNITVNDIYDLCVIEAANFIDQGGRDKLIFQYQTIWSLWITSVSYNFYKKAIIPKFHYQKYILGRNKNICLKIFPIFYFDSENTMLSNYNDNRYNNGITVTLRLYHKHEQYMNVLRDQLLSIFNIVDENMKSNVLISFTLLNEYLYGMPLSPIYMLYLYQNRSCCGYMFSTYVPLEINCFIRIYRKPLHSIPYRLHIPSHTSFDLEKIIHPSENPQFNKELVCQMINSLREDGWALIRVSDSYANIIRKAYLMIIYFMSTVSLERKRKFIHRFDGPRYVGYAQDNGREWLQLRSGCEELDWPISDFSQPLLDALNRIDNRNRNVSSLGLDEAASGNGSKDECVTNTEQGITHTVQKNEEGVKVLPSVSDILLSATKILEQTAQQLWEVIAVEIGLSKTQAIEMTRRDDMSKYGPSVQRMFVYKDRSSAISQNSFASGAHADMGLFTLSPRSTHPALELLHPRTQAVINPEHFMNENEWILFPGETFGYLSGGGFLSPIHRVQWVDRAPGDTQRCSMPLFLRASPSYPLVPQPISSQFQDCVASQFASPMTCAKFMQTHALARRPWRLEAGGDY